MNKKTHWILVANASEANIYATDKSMKDLRHIHTFENIEGRLKVTELMTGDRGRTRARGNSSVQSAMEPATDRHTVEMQQFVKELSDWLHKASTRHAYEALILVAGPELLGMLRDGLTTPVQNSLMDSINKDYTELKPDDLASRVRGQLQA